MKSWLPFVRSLSTRAAVSSEGHEAARAARGVAPGTTDVVAISEVLRGEYGALLAAVSSADAETTPVEDPKA